MEGQTARKRRGPQLSASPSASSKAAYKNYEKVDAVNMKTVVELHSTHSLSSYIYGDGETNKGYKCRGHRAGKSVVAAGDVLLIDIDNKETLFSINELKDCLSDYVACITPSRNSSEKVSKFHAVVQLDENLPLSAAAFKRIYRAAMQWLGLEGVYDPSMETWTQQLSPYRGNKSETWVSPGSDLLSVEQILDAYTEPEGGVNSVRGFSGHFIPQETLFTLSSGPGQLTVREMQDLVLRQGRQRVHCIDGLRHDGRWDTAFVDVNESGSVYYYCTGGRCGVTHWMIDDGFEAEDADEDEHAASIGYQETFLGDDTEPFRFIIDGLIPASSFGVAGAGGTMKTTMMLSMMLHIVLGKPFAGRTIKHPGPCLMVTAEDELPIVRHRVRKLCEGMGLTDAEKRQVGAKLFIEDVSSKVARLVELDSAGNLMFSGYLGVLLGRYARVSLSMVVFDPMVYFGAGERFVNDNEGLLMAAARKLSERFKCATGFIHHTGKQAAREGTVDAYAGRGGSAFADNSRAMMVMVPNVDSRLPPPEDFLESVESFSRVVVAKQSYGKREETPLYVGRDAVLPWLLTYGWGQRPQDEQTAREMSEEAFQEAVVVAVYRAVKLMRDKGLYPNKTLIREHPIYVGDKKVAQKKIGVGVEVAVQRGHVVVNELAEHLRHGGSKYYYTPGLMPVWSDDDGLIRVEDLE